MVGFHIVFWFHKLNEEEVPARAPSDKDKVWGRPCILYCGPSNKSVDVLAGALGQPRGAPPWGCWAQQTVSCSDCPQDCF